MSYHEINRRQRRYEYRYEDDGKMTGWINAGPATREALETIQQTMHETFCEVREVRALADERGEYIGELIVAQLVWRQEP